MKKEVISKATLLRLLEYLTQENSEKFFDLKYSNGESEYHDLMQRMRGIDQAFRYLRTLIEDQSEFNETLERLAKEYMIK